MPSFLDQIFTMLMNKATMVVLVRRELKRATGSMSRVMAPVRVLGVPMRCLTIQFKTPVWLRPAMTAKRTPITRTDGAQKPPNAPLTSRTPLMNKADMAATKMRSVRNFENIMDAKSARITAIVNHAFPESPNSSKESKPCNMLPSIGEIYNNITRFSNG